MIGATSHRCTSLAGVAVSSRLFIDEEYTNGTYPTPDCNFVNFVLSGVGAYFSKLSAQQPAQILYGRRRYEEEE
eukprot:scaffold22356_cov64-Skeletonema_dohrnii-CCMP3373.AAC.1